MIELNCAKLDEALSNLYTLPEDIYFHTDMDMNSTYYFVMLEDGSNNLLSLRDTNNILDKLNSDILIDDLGLYIISLENANALIKTINYMPKKAIAYHALCSLADVLNTDTKFKNSNPYYPAHCAKNKLYIPFTKHTAESEIIDYLELKYNLQCINKPRTSWGIISYLEFVSKDPESLYTLLRIQGKLIKID